MPTEIRERARRRDPPPWLEIVRLYLLLAGVRWIDMRLNGLYRGGRAPSGGQLLHLIEQWLALHEAAADILRRPLPPHVEEVRGDPAKAEWRHGTEFVRCRKEPPVTLDPETLIVVRRHWNDWKQGTVPLRCLSGLHRGSISGGVQTASPRPMLMGYIMCTDLVSGEIAHSCQHGPPPHRVKVTIVKKDNERSVIATLKAQLDADNPQR